MKFYNFVILGVLYTTKITNKIYDMIYSRFSHINNFLLLKFINLINLEIQLIM